MRRLKEISCKSCYLQVIKELHFITILGSTATQARNFDPLQGTQSLCFSILVLLSRPMLCMLPARPLPLGGAGAASYTPAQDVFWGAAGRCSTGGTSPQSHLCDTERQAQAWADFRDIVYRTRGLYGSYKSIKLERGVVREGRGVFLLYPTRPTQGSNKNALMNVALTCCVAASNVQGPLHVDVVTPTRPVAVLGSESASPWRSIYWRYT